MPEVDIIEIILNRRSLRRYQLQTVPQDVIKKLLHAATWAPSAHNRQPWRFVVIEGAEAKEQLAQAMGSRLQHDLMVDHVPEAIIEKDVRRSYERITSAPVIIVLCLSMSDMDTYSDDKRNTNEYIMAVQSTAMAGQNLLLAAHGLGLGACWMCAPLFCPDVVVDVLGLASDWQPQGMITLGYPAQEREKDRHPLENQTIWR